MYDFQNRSRITKAGRKHKRIFDKGGAIRMAQTHVYNLYTECLILLLDSDIYLPDNFQDIIKSQKFEVNTLYHPTKRLDFYKLSDFYGKQDYFDYPWIDDFQGFFQMYYYKEKTYFYQKSNKCYGCDLKFKQLFSEQKQLDFTVYHLGKNGVNWEGRKGIDFIIDTEIL